MSTSPALPDVYPGVSPRNEWFIGRYGIGLTGGGFHAPVSTGRAGS